MCPATQHLLQRPLPRPPGRKTFEDGGRFYVESPLHRNSQRSLVKPMAAPLKLDPPGWGSRRARVVQSFPSEEALIRLVGAVCCEASEDWSSRRYMEPSAIEGLWGRELLPVPEPTECV